MGKKFDPPPYKIGEYITGIDRSYPRSIYKYHGMNKWQTKVGFEFLAIEGRSYTHIKGHIQYFPAKIATEYRKATRQELIDEGVIPQSLDFITHL